ncbi:PAS domain-containing protein [Streptomyces sp. DSM 44917]|uniref:PAS domain-containing protein n=1 Tax=Streptomyces boetiae TaxID=3075541 RepID=A0ABU2LDP5_9ACTN|nr:PAS domain-containing protein [Streptomyces sp. DSM 44917]MDT0309704.1 PAS domain-containing protein [Streptomyces sp. DSM 44917]
MADAEEFGTELTDFRHRVAELRASRTLPGGAGPAVLDAALFELQFVSDVLWPRWEKLAAEQRRAARPADSREQHLLRAVFQRLPLPVVLLDRDAVVSRLNFAASQLFGLRAGYAAGRPITASFAHEGRAAFRSQVAAVARNEGSRSLAVELMGVPGEGAGDPGEPEHLWVTLAAVRPPGHRRTAVLAVCQPMAASGAAALPARAPGPAEGADGAGQPDPRPISGQVALMDLVDDMATTLLAAAGPEGEDLTPLERACRLLHGRFADWVIGDRATPGGGPLRRVAVLGPPEADRDGGREDVAGEFGAQDPAAAPVVAEAARAGASALQIRPEEPLVLGATAEGVPLLALTGASSLLCMPLKLPSGTVLGVVTLLRTGSRPAFELAEASAMERMSRHIALAIRAS